MALATVDDWYGARRVRFADAKRRNALALDTVQQLVAELSVEPERVLVLGSDDPAVFSAGADLKASDAERAQISDTLYAIYELMISRPGPVIAVVEGIAVGGGAQLAAAADVRVLGPQARMRWVGAGHGLVVGAWILPALVGRSRAIDAALTSRWLDAQRMVDYGFAAEISSEPWVEAQALVERIIALDREAVADFKQIATMPTIAEQLRRERERNTTWNGVAHS